MEVRPQTVTAPRVVVLAYGAPSVKFVAWFLAGSGVINTRVTEVDAACRLVDHPVDSVVVINSNEPSDAIANAVQALRHHSGSVCIVHVRDGNHPHGDRHVDADICVHDGRDLDHLVWLVRALCAERAEGTAAVA
jgi:hypothetical protein